MSATTANQVTQSFDAVTAVAQHIFAKADGNPRGAEACDTLGEQALGVTNIGTNDKAPAGDAQAISIVMDGVALVQLEAGAGVSAGDEVTTGATGGAVTAVATNWVMGVCKEGSADTSGTALISVNLTGPYVKA